MHIQITVAKMAKFRWPALLEAWNNFIVSISHVLFCTSVKKKNTKKKNNNQTKKPNNKNQSQTRTKEKAFW